VTGKESTVADVKPGVKVIVYFRTLDGALGHVRLIRIFPDELPTIVQEEPMINIDMAAEAQTGVQSAGSETK
jgi:hypothetical protein